MLGLVGIILLNTKRISDHVKENIGFSVFLKDEVKEADIENLKKNLDAAAYTKTADFISKDEAARQLQKDLVGEDFVRFLGFNPLSALIDVRLNAGYANNDSIAWIEKELLQNPYVKEVYYQKSLVSLVNENVKKISFAFLSFASLLLIISIALINNTIRLSIYSKRFLIKTMQLVGATPGFIRMPFIWKSIRHGIYGALIALFLLFGLVYFVKKQLPELFQIEDLELFASLSLIIIVLGVIISGLSTLFAVRKYLRIRIENLYN